MSNDDINARRREQVKLNMLTVAAVAGWYIDTYLDKKPCRDSTLSGAAYVNELLIGHLERFRQVCHMERPIFMELCNVIRSKNLLCDTRDITLEEQLIMFLFTIGHNAVNRQVQERFQNSGKYYLVDAGYGNTPNYIAPYRGVRYHLREFARGSIGSQDAKELFNLHHSSLRNAIERVFGVIKNRFPILKNTSSHSFNMVTDVIIVCCTLHNFIHSYSNGEDWIYEEYDLQYENQSSEQEDINEPDDDYSTDGRRREGNRMREAIAKCYVG
ncbi:putative nuclease HARBI1 [Cinnamomum micranthum f. kanehirae]|uniref:Putative nuclease HARBI1 n=1 Tax=Cinnamomum micranthum f. kanehirae TaxID=337451 RepID=A0A3S3PA54_9MAGN|nr:putative nuclease HARBI1 [Cinnamomum micranthum f. kanehirae]